MIINPNSGYAAVKGRRPYLVLPRTALLPAHPTAPLIEIRAGNGNSRTLLNSASAIVPFSNNLFPYFSGDIRNNGSATAPAVTKYYALDALGAMKACRLLWSATGSIFNWFTSSVNAPAFPPAGEYTAYFDAVSNKGVALNVRVGSSSAPADLTVKTINTTTTAVTKTIVTDGTNYASFGIYNDGTAAGADGGSDFPGRLPDITVSNMRIVKTGDVYTAEANNNNAQRRIAFDGGFLFANGGKSIDNATGNNTATAGGYSIIKSADYDTFTADNQGTTLAELSAYAVVSLLDATRLGVIFNTEANTALGTTTNSFQMNASATTGVYATQPITAGVSVIGLLNQGFVLIGLKLGATERCSLYNELMLHYGTTAFAGLKYRILQFLGTATSTQFNGRVPYFSLFPVYHSQAQTHTECEYIRYIMGLDSITMETRPDVVSGIGDSRTAGARPTGTAWPGLIGVNDAVTAGRAIPVRNFANSGYGVDNLVTQLTTNPVQSFPVGPGGIRDRFKEVHQMGKRNVACIWIGVNDASYINTNGAAAYWTNKLAPYLTLVRSYLYTGDKIVLFTELPATLTGIPTWETLRLALNVIMRANTSYYDVLYDQGDVSTTMGNPANLSNGTLWDIVSDSPDTLHPAQGGENEIRDGLAAILATL